MRRFLNLLTRLLFADRDLTEAEIRRHIEILEKRRLRLAARAMSMSREANYWRDVLASRQSQEGAY